MCEELHTETLSYQEEHWQGLEFYKIAIKTEFLEWVLENDMPLQWAWLSVGLSVMNEYPPVKNDGTDFDTDSLNTWYQCSPWTPCIRIIEFRH